MRSGGVVAAMLIAGGALRAQGAAQLDVEAASVRAVGFERAAGLSVAPSARYDIPFLTIAGDGALATYGAQRYTGRLFGQAAVHATLRRLTLEGAVSATRLAFRQEADAKVASVAAVAAPVARAQDELESHARAEIVSGPWSVWGSGGRRALRYGPTRSSWDNEVGVQRAFERFITSVSVHSSEFRTVGAVHVFVPASEVASVSEGMVTSYPDTVRRWQHDLLASTGVLLGRAELSIDAGVRLNGWRTGERWAALVGSWRLDERLTVIGSAGSNPSDRVRALPAAAFATLGVRLQRGRPPFEDWFRAPDLPAFRIDTLGGGGHVVRVRAPRAIRMEVTGDFTDWTALPMRLGERGEWEIVLPIAPGTYHLSLRVDGGRWRAPPGLVPVVDEFGSESAIVVVR